MITRQADDLTALVDRILQAAGADEENAHAVAEHLVLANLSGVDSHGVWHVRGYVEMIQNDQCVPAAKPRILSQTANSLRVTGSWGFGHTAAAFTMERAIAKAADQGMAIAALVESNHIGRLGHYVEMAATAGMISLVALGGQGNAHPTAVPHGGREPKMHTNPVAMGFPGGEKPPMYFDFATTAVAGVKIVNAVNRKEQIPIGLVVDAEGAPSCDPNDLFNGGGHLPFGGHKGYALMLAVDYRGRIFAGSDRFNGRERGGIYDRYAGTCMIVFKADLFQPFSEYAGAADEMGERVRSSQPARDTAEVLVPGDLEERCREERRRNGIPIEEDVWGSIREAGRMVGIDDI